MARDQFSIHISRKPGPNAAWGVDTVRFSTDLGRHSVYPEGRKLDDVVIADFAETILDAVAQLDRERRLLNRPDFEFATQGVGLQGMFCHLDEMNDGLVRVTIRIRAVLGSAIRLLAERDGAIEASPSAAALSHAEIAALTALERVLLPLMNATEALQHRLARLPVDMRLTLLLAQVRHGCVDASALTRSVLDREAPNREAPAIAGSARAVPCGTPPGDDGHAEAPDRLPTPPGDAALPAPEIRVLPALLDAWSRDADPADRDAGATGPAPSR